LAIECVSGVGVARIYMTVEFVDTSVLTHAYGDPDDRRSSAARVLLERLAKEHTGAVSIQVLQEFWVTLTRKVTPPVDPEVARARLTALERWRVYTPRPSDVIMDAASGNRL
jgi:predicted nucleic acid-binding protein